MNLAFSKATRVAFITLCSSATFQACGSLNEGTVTVIDSNNAGATTAGGGDQNAGATGGEQNIGAGNGGETTGQGGTASEACMANLPCLSGSDTGICVAGVCVSCTDPDDDEACQNGYGEGYLCLNGSCTQAQCRTEDDCNGEACVGHACASCANDSDCLEADTICNLATGACVTNKSCDGASAGDVCPVNELDKCCGNVANAICEAVECCGSGPCQTSPDANGNDGTCKSGNCVLIGCDSPPVAVRFVDFAAPPGGSGAKTCPYAKLAPALDDLTATGGTVLIKSGGAIAVDFTSTIPPGIIITGADAEFAACTPATCSNPEKWPLITTGDRRAMVMLTPGERTVRFLRLQGVDLVDYQTAEWAAFYANSATVNVDHVDVSGYQYGFYADTAGSFQIGGGVLAHVNRVGLYIENGEASTGGSALIELKANDDPTGFDYNNTGISVKGNGLLVLTGPPWSASQRGLITANKNGGSGVYFPAANAKGLIDGLEAASNGNDKTLGQHDGATLFAHAVVKIRNSYFHDNVASGIHISGNGANSADGLAAIDLGRNKASGAGHNTFVDNADAGICVESGPAKTAAQNSLSALGNTFGTKDCTGTGTYTRASDCEGSGVDYAGACAGAADLGGCTAAPMCE